MKTFDHLALAIVTLTLQFETIRAGAEQPGESETTSLQEVVVTAQRRSERLLDVPMSITALSADTLEKSGVANTSDIASVTPSVVMPFYGAYLQPSIRGVSSTGANVGDNSNVALYIDGVYQPQQIASLVDLPDVEQIEVLKGPQGSLYGQNATGGAILVNTLVPSFSPSGKMSVSYGNYDDVNVRGYVTGGITDTVAGSLTGGFEKHDGYRTQLITEQRDRGLDSKLVRAKLLFEPIRQVKLTLTSYVSDRVDSSQYAGIPLGGNSVGYALIPTAPVPTRPDQFAVTPGAYAEVKSSGSSIRGEISFDVGTINTTTSYTQNQISYLADVDFSPVNYAQAYAGLHARYLLQETYFASNTFGAFSFLAGALFLKGDETFDPSGFDLTPPNLLPEPSLLPVYNIHEYGRLHKDVYAPYLELIYHVTDSLILTADGRYTHEQQRAYSNLATPNPAVITEYQNDPVTFAKFTPRVTARYELDTNSNIYASWGQGFKSGLVNTLNFEQTPVNPEVITAYEVGYKTKLMDTVSLNAAAFYYNYRDLQVVAYEPPNYIEQNAASARIKGVEMDAAWALAHDFSLSGGIAYLDARYKSFPAAEVFVPTGFGGNSAITKDLSGKRMLRAPELTADISGNYQLDTSVGRFGAFATYYYNSGYGFEVSNRLWQSAYSTLSAELSFVPAVEQHLKLALWGKNLTDKAYFDSVLASQLADGGSYAAPRTFGGRVEFHF